MVVDIAGNSNGGTRILAHTANLATLEPDLDVLARHDLGTVVLCLFVLVDHCGGRARTPAEDGASLGC